MKNIIRNFFVAIIVMIAVFTTIYYSVIYASKKIIVFDNSDIMMIIFFGILSLVIIFTLLCINYKLNMFENALFDISNKIDVTEENMVNLERSTQKIILKEVKENREFRRKFSERVCYEEKSEQQSEQEMD